MYAILDSLRVLTSQGGEFSNKLDLIYRAVGLELNLWLESVKGEQVLLILNEVFSQKADFFILPRWALSCLGLSLTAKESLLYILVSKGAVEKNTP